MGTDSSGAIASPNMKLLSRVDFGGGGQVVVQDGYAFVGHMSPPEGTSIIDVRDARNPKVVAHIPPPNGYSHTHKVRVAGHLMITNVERDRRHFYRKGEAIAGITGRLAQQLGRAPSDAEIAVELGVRTEDVPVLRAGLERGYSDGGFRVWDISDPGRPRLLSYVRTGGIGVHRFDMDERYAYISTEMPGYVGNILVIYDLADPTRPEEVSRWWIPGQHVAGGETPSWTGQRYRLHHALRQGDIMWAAGWYGGAFAIDIADIARPKTAGSWNYHPPFPEPTHTFFRMPQPIGGRQVALVIDEEHDHIPGQPHAFLWIVDVSDLSDIQPISTFGVGELASPYAATKARFGAHQFQERQIGNLVFATWFSGGLRVVDIADPTLPKEIGHFIPEPYAGQIAPQSNDVDVDDEGRVFLIDRNRGLEVLQFEG